MFARGQARVGKFYMHMNRPIEEVQGMVMQGIAGLYYQEH